MFRRAASAAFRLALTIGRIAEFIRGFLRFRRNYIIRRWTGARSLADARRIAIFVHYDRRGRVHDYVIHYLNALVKAGFEIVFVSNSPSIASHPSRFQCHVSVKTSRLRRRRER